MILCFVEKGQLLLPSFPLLFLHLKLSLVVLHINDETWSHIGGVGAEEVIISFALHHHVVAQCSWSIYHGGVPKRISTSILLTLCSGNIFGLIFHHGYRSFNVTGIVRRLFSHYWILFLLPHIWGPSRRIVFGQSVVQSFRKLWALIFAGDCSEDWLSLLSDLFELGFLILCGFGNLLTKSFIFVIFIFWLANCSILLACRIQLRVLVVSTVIVYGSIKLRHYFFDRPNCVQMPFHVIILVVLMFQSSKLICQGITRLLLSILGQEWSFKCCSIDARVFWAEGLHNFPVALDFGQENVSVILSLVNPKLLFVLTNVIT